MYNKIKKHRNWIFSGIGTALIVFFVNSFFSKENKNVTTIYDNSKQNSNNVYNNSNTQNFETQNIFVNTPKQNVKDKSVIKQKELSITIIDLIKELNIVDDRFQIFSEEKRMRAYVWTKAQIPQINPNSKTLGFFFNEVIKPINIEQSKAYVDCGIILNELGVYYMYAIPDPDIENNKLVVSGGITFSELKENDVEYHFKNKKEFFVGNILLKFPDNHSAILNANLLKQIKQVIKK